MSVDLVVDARHGFVPREPFRKSSTRKKLLRCDHFGSKTSERVRFDFTRPASLIDDS
jgi:hypothetical protein